MRKFPDIKTHHYSPEELAHSIEQAHKAVELDEHKDEPVKKAAKADKVAKKAEAHGDLKEDDSEPLPKPSLTHATTHKSEPLTKTEKTEKPEPKKEKKEDLTPKARPVDDKPQHSSHNIDFEKIAE